MEKLVNKENPDVSVWPSMAVMARDLGYPYVNVQAWFRAGNIPWYHRHKVIETAARRGHVLTEDDFAKAR